MHERRPIIGFCIMSAPFIDAESPLSINLRPSMNTRNKVLLREVEWKQGLVWGSKLLDQMAVEISR